jgi:NAD(P)-dependent dehydrogenase (short-subunit alcohol dehydrogenase family)
VAYRDELFAMSTYYGRSVLITGGGTGIGKGCAEHFLGRGATVANAGTAWPGPVQLLDKAQWHIAYDVNVVGTALCIKHASPAMRGSGAGAVVAISCVEALRASRFMPAYNVTKAALDTLVACAARELGPLGIRVNGVRPGVVLTDAVRAQLTEKSLTAGLRQTYLNRLGTPADIAGAVAFLSSPDASWVTGQMLNVCGGLSVHDGANYEGLASDGTAVTSSSASQQERSRRCRPTTQSSNHWRWSESRSGCPPSRIRP